jgi:hypothetical protein
MVKTRTNDGIQLESQAGLLQLAEALEKACVTSEDFPQQLTQVAARVVVDAEPNAGKGQGRTAHPLARSAYHRMTGYVIATLELNNGGTRNICNRWRYLPPRFEHGVLVGRPSISITEKLRVHCKDCGNNEAMFVDAVVSGARGKGVKCSKCGSVKTERDYMRLTCTGKGKLENGEDDVFSCDGKTGVDVEQELDCLSSMHKQGYDENTALILPRLWCGYDIKPDIEFEPQDRMAQQIIHRGLNPTKAANGALERPVAHMVPFDVMMPLHSRDSKAKTPALRYLVLETLGDAGWASKEELQGSVPSLWKRTWMSFPSERPRKFDRDNFQL